MLVGWVLFPAHTEKPTSRPVLRRLSRTLASQPGKKLRPRRLIFLEEFLWYFVSFGTVATCCFRFLSRRLVLPLMLLVAFNLPTALSWLQGASRLSSLPIVPVVLFVDILLCSKSNKAMQVCCQKVVPNPKVSGRVQRPEGATAAPHSFSLPK